MSANKLLDHEENPIDRLLLRCTEQFMPWFAATGHTPNTLTTYSFVLGLLGVYQLHVGNHGLFVLLLYASYLFDCMDGQMARKYKLVTAFGDVYDHLTDALVAILVALTAARLLGGTNLCIPTLAVFGAMLTLTGTHFGCQQRIVVAQREGTVPHETIDRLQIMCPDPSYIIFTRWFGTGTLYALGVPLLAMACGLARRKTTDTAV